MFFSRISKLCPRMGNSRFLSLLTLPWYSMAETLRESSGVSSLDRFGSNQASALTDLTGTARSEYSRFFSSGPDSSDSFLHRFKTHLPLAVTDLTCTARRDFSSLLPQTPYLWGGFNKIISRESTGSKIVRHSFYDPTMEKEVVSGEEMYPAVLSCHLVGASHGWFVRTDGDNVYLTDLLKPWVSSPRVISLPSLKLKVSFHKNAVSLSSSDPVQGDDCWVVAKFNQISLSVCRLCNSKWTHIELPRSLLPVSKLTYSKRDKAFFFTSSQGKYLGLIDLRNNKVKCRYLHLRDIPFISDAGWRVLGKCVLTQHLVVSPSGELIFIRWYTTCTEEELFTGVELYPINSKRFMVFREDEVSKNFYYTEDIGDLCIFLSQSEDFCVSVNMYPGLRPNSIYYTTGPGVGCYSLDSGKIQPLNVKGMYPGFNWISPC